MEAGKSFSVVEIKKNKFLIIGENKKLYLTLNLTEKSVNIMIKKYLIATNFEGIYLLDDFLKTNKIFSFYDSLEIIFNLLKKKILDKNFELEEEDTQIKLIFSFSSENISVNVPLILKKGTDLDVYHVLEEMTNLIISLDEKVQKLEHLQFYDDSKIIKKGEMEMIKSWINKKFLQTKLIYRLSKDGDKAADFHSKCDGKGPTLVIIENTIGKRFGGFTSLKWTSENIYLKNDLTSFIFSIDNMTKFACTDQIYNIHGGLDYGPTFGGGHDLYITDQCSSSDNNYSKFPYSYGKDIIPDKSFYFIAGSVNFKVKEIEVYLVE